VWLQSELKLPINVSSIVVALVLISRLHGCVDVRQDGPSLEVSSIWESPPRPEWVRAHRPGQEECRLAGKYPTVFPPVEKYSKQLTTAHVVY
jgi:hypothetical protein